MEVTTHIYVHFACVFLLIAMKLNQYHYQTLYNRTPSLSLFGHKKKTLFVRNYYSLSYLTVHIYDYQSLLFKDDNLNCLHLFPMCFSIHVNVLFIAVIFFCIYRKHIKEK